MSKINKQADDPVRVYLWADPNEEGIFWDQPLDAGEGYRKPKKYTEADRRALERAIGEDVKVIKP
jgi:hypothetical protein